MFICVRVTMTPAGLEPAIPGSVGRCLIHWATGPPVCMYMLCACKYIYICLYICIGVHIFAYMCIYVYHVYTYTYAWTLPERLELSTLRLTASRSNQLS